MRKALDKLVSWFGLALTLFLLVAGGMLVWANNFITNQVSDQLSSQQITMPAGGAIDSLPPADKAALEPFAGQQMTNGAQAEAFANHYILVHMNEGTATLFKTLQGMGINTTQWDSLAPLTYSTAGTVSSDIKDPAKTPGLTDQQRTDGAAAVSDFRTGTLFTGNTLRGMLLNAYAFGTMGTIAGLGAIFAFIGAAILALLTGLGFWHAARQPKTAPEATKQFAPVTA